MMYARYTVVLKTLLENVETKQQIYAALSEYPLYTPKTTNEDVLQLLPTRENLNTTLLNNYKYREIGFETPGRFIDELKIAMNDIMPLYNQLYKSVEIMGVIDDPFGNVDVTETYNEEKISSGESTGTTNGTVSANDSSTNNGTTNGNGRNITSQTPQNMLDIDTIDNVNYADSATWNKDTATTTGTTSGESESESNTSGASTFENVDTLTRTFTKKGNQGVNTYAHDMVELRETFLNVTNQIINDTRIQELFMQVY